MKIARAALLCGLAMATGAHAAVFRCTAADGHVTYQDSPCAGNEAARATDIPTQFPPPNEAERARILQREAQLEARLEARRERESREAALRLAAAPVPVPAPAADEGYPVYFPVVAPYFHPRPQRHHAGPRVRSMPFRP
jgi:hypothetical protein